MQSSVFRVKRSNTLSAHSKKPFRTLKYF